MKGEEHFKPFRSEGYGSAFSELVCVCQLDCQFTDLRAKEIIDNVETCRNPFLEGVARGIGDSFILKWSLLSKPFS